jgi:hypothetical protein
MKTEPTTQQTDDDISKKPENVNTSAEHINAVDTSQTDTTSNEAKGDSMSKIEWAYHKGKGYSVDLKKLSATDLSYLIDIAVEEMASRIDSQTKELSNE